MMTVDKRQATQMGFYPGVEINHVNGARGGCILIELYDDSDGENTRGNIGVLTIQEARAMARHILEKYPETKQDAG